MNGNGIQLGKTKIVKTGDAEITIAYAMLSNKAAKEVPVEFEGKKETDTPTDIELISGQDPEDPMRIQIPERCEKYDMAFIM